MLPTTAIKADTTVASASGKDKDAGSSALAANFSAYFSQMVAAMPAMAASLPESQPAVATPPARPAESSKKPAQTEAKSTPSQVNAGAQGDPNAQAGASAQAGATSQAGATTQTGTGAQTGSAQPDATGTQATGAQQAPAAAGSGQGQAAPLAAAGGTAGPAPQTSAKPAPDPAPAAAAAAPATTAAAEEQSAANAKDALAKAVPGAKFDMQYGGAAAPMTSKAPLTELINQIQMDTNASAAAQKASLPETALAAPVAAAPAAPVVVDPMAALQALLAPQQAGQTALAAMPAAAPTVAASAGSIAGNAAAAQAVGAGAQPGASGSVRVTASASTATSRPAGEPNLASQVDGTIRWLVKNQDQGAELQLHPESLGRIQIKLKVEGNVVHAKVWASDAAAVPVLQDHRATLEASLKAQGLTLGSFDLQHGHRQQQESLPTPTEPASTPAVSLAPASTGQETPVSGVNAGTHTSRIEYVA